MKKNGVVTWFLIVFLVACQSATSAPTPQPNVSFDSNAFAEYTGVTISFHHPREWQIGYVSDSGAFGWMIADADPNKVFWAANQTGNEIAIILMGGTESSADSDPAKILEQMGTGSINAKINEFKEKDKQVAYVLNSGEIRAVAIIHQKIFTLFGNYPKDKETAVQNGIETVLHSLALQDAKGKDFSNETTWGTRNEGLLLAGTNRDGYVPLSSMSIWTIDGKKGQEIKISIGSDDLESKLMLNILDKDGKSIFPSGAISFAGKYETDQIRLPTAGSYIVQLSGSQWYGWYQIALK